MAKGITRSFTAAELQALPLKPHADLTLLGKSLPALDIHNKTTGQAIYGIDFEGGGHGPCRADPAADALWLHGHGD